MLNTVQLSAAELLLGYTVASHSSEVGRKQRLITSQVNAAGQAFRHPEHGLEVSLPLPPSVLVSHCRSIGLSTNAKSWRELGASCRALVSIYLKKKIKSNVGTKWLLLVWKHTIQWHLRTNQDAVEVALMRRASFRITHHGENSFQCWTWVLNLEPAVAGWRNGTCTGMMWLTSSSSAAILCCYPLPRWAAEPGAVVIARCPLYPEQPLLSLPIKDNWEIASLMLQLFPGFNFHN